jgi:bifunctional DNA-binding transcriptional regulator/antitoxin component of YhaV-PrlF toxin-antitoxin module
MPKKPAVHKLKKNSAYSYSLTIPKEIIARYGWKEKQKFVIIDQGRGKIEISDWRKR